MQITGLPIFVCLTKTVEIGKEGSKGIKNSEAYFEDIPGEKGATLTTRGAKSIVIRMDKKLDSILLSVNEYSENRTIEYIIIYWLRDRGAYFYGDSFDRDATKVFKYYFGALKRGKYIKGKIEGKEIGRKKYLEFLEKIEIK